MFTLKPVAVCITMLTIASSALAQAPQFGQPIAPADIAAWDISIGPDGVGLPPGRGTASEGEAIYVAKCQACHGVKGTRPDVALAGALVGGMGTLAPDKTPIKTVGSFWPLRNNTVRLYPSRNAIPGVEIAHLGRSLCSIGLYPQSQRDCRIERCDRCAVAAQGENAEPGRVHPVPAQSEVASGRTLVG